MEDVDVVVHLQAWNPYPEATWHDSQLSMDMTAHTIEAAKTGGVPILHTLNVTLTLIGGVSRFIFASSNHVFGKYWREGSDLHQASPITRSTPPNVGTTFRVPSFDCDATPYAAAKLAGESMLRAAVASQPGFSGVALRIGWCQPGENLPDTMSVTGTPTISEEGEGPTGQYTELARGYDDGTNHSVILGLMLTLIQIRFDCQVGGYWSGSRICGSLTEICSSASSDAVTGRATASRLSMG